MTRSTLLWRQKKPLFENAFADFNTNKVDILSLQEAGDEIEDLLPENYSVFRGTEDEISHDSVIAWNNEKFECIESTYDHDNHYVLVILKDRVTGEEVIATSAHLTGLPLHESENIKNQQGEYGNNQLLALVDAIREKSQQRDQYGRKRTIILGADMNASQELYSARLDIPQEGLNLNRVTGDFAADQRIDQLFFKATAGRVEAMEKLNAAHPLMDLEHTPSDHAPFFANIKTNL